MFNYLVLFTRSLLFLCGQILSTILVATTALILFPLPYRARYFVITRWSHFIIWWAKMICGIRYEVIGVENLPQQNAIVLCKHQSAWETLFLQVLLPPQTWVLKKELLQIPFFGWALQLIEPIAIDRKKSSSIKQLLNDGKDRLTKGRWVIIFPEGKRMAVGKTGRYSRSGAMLAKESGAYVVPIAHNAGVCWPRSAFIKKPGIIKVVIGKAIDPRLWSIDEINDQAQAWIEKTTQELPQQH